MLLPTTETSATGPAIDTLSGSQAATACLKAQSAALASVETATGAIDAGATAMAAAVRDGHRLIYAAAGSSGLMALADASELHGTFGVPQDAVQIHMAGGVPIDGRMPGNTEDATDMASEIGLGIGESDVVIVLSASGTTPYAIAIAEVAKARGATVIGIANNAGTRLLEHADIAVCLGTPPEIIAGSTRLGAATAQKVALNAMSTLMGVKLGHVYQGLMVNVVADNAKLIQRATRIVSQIAGVTEAQAQAALTAADGHTKAAILVAVGHSAAQAHTLLAAHKGHLHDCLQSHHKNQIQNDS